VAEEIVAVRRSPDAAGRARADLGLPAGRTTLAAFGGSLGARHLNEVVMGLAERWAARSDVAIYHVTGRRHWEGSDASAPPAPAGSSGSAASAGLAYVSVPYEDHMARLYTAADLVVSRAGAMTVAEIAVVGVPAVLVPLPGSPGDHQTANARALDRAGGAVVIPDERFDVDELARTVEGLVADRGRLAEMSSASARLGRADAAGRVADLVVAHAR
jgi:UDP-N-acetylglucosamine:LPS N-acetylglucosamine transferase